MNRKIVAPEEIDFESRGRRDYFVRLEHPSVWGSYLIPVTVLAGPAAKPGRGIVGFGSTHGDEYEGPVVLKHLLREIPTEDVVGRVILVPVLSVPAFRAGEREAPDDGGNLNRAFPGDAKGSITSRIADFVHRFIFPQVHTVLDLHSGGEVARFLPLSSVHFVPDAAQRKAMEETARGFGTRIIMRYQNLTPGLLTSTAESLGKITVGTELGFGRALQPEGVSMGRQGFLTAAIRQEQMKGPVPENRHTPPAEQILIDASAPGSSVLAPTDGHFEPVVDCGAEVRKGQRIAWLHDFGRIDEPPLELVAPHDGFILCEAWNARVFQGQVAFQVAKPADWTP